ncbi:MAG: HAMP domain-containing sensor histidine kinase [Candidatus Contendobacter sp.]|nr:HAMP domain-containing sensor histidine kinase [Candidatus Contendobacter sp.]
MPTASPNARSSLVWLLVACGFLLAPAALAGETRHVLVLYSNHRLLPANLEFEAGLRETLADSTELSAEFLDYPRFDGASYIRALALFLNEKYARRPPGVLVAAGEESLDFLLRHRAELFPRIPMVHGAVARSFLSSLPPLPADVVGVPIEYDFPGTIDLALRWHPRARRLVVVTGTSAQDHAWEAKLRGEISQFQDRVTVEFLVGLPTDAILKRLSELGGDAVVFTPGYFEDGVGRQFSPREAARLMAAAAAAPVYGPFDTFIGTGIVGGSMPNFGAMGRQAGEIANALLAGVAPTALRLPEIMLPTVNVDWRQVRRWDIDANAIPGDAIVRFKEPTFLEAHRNEAIMAAAVFLLQAGLIAWLLVERRRRRLANLAVQQQRFELAHAARLAVAGELTGAIAHEINQPLGAILSNADTADLLLASGADQRDELRAILADIRRDDLRASVVIQRLRALLARQPVERQPFDLNSAVREMEPVLQPEARRRGVALEVRPAATTAPLVGDRVQIQQVLLNLVLNALDAVNGLPEARRTVAVSVERDADRVILVVRDRGHGIAPEHLPKLFDSFFSTKRRGMGLGLSIARTLVEVHGGRIRAESRLGEGAVFQAEWPVAGDAGSLGPA